MNILKGIVATDPNGIIGSAGTIPWSIKEDFAFFKHITCGNVLIMGHTTYKTLDKPLKGRYTIVLSSQAQYQPTYINLEENTQVHWCADKPAAYRLAQRLMNTHRCDTFICGGVRVYTDFLQSISEFYVTKVLQEYDGDTDIRHILDAIHGWDWQKLFDIQKLATVYRAVDKRDHNYVVKFDTKKDRD